MLEVNISQKWESHGSLGHLKNYRDTNFTQTCSWKCLKITIHLSNSMTFFTKKRQFNDPRIILICRLTPQNNPINPSSCIVWSPQNGSHLMIPVYDHEKKLLFKSMMVDDKGWFYHQTCQRNPNNDLEHLNFHHHPTFKKRGNPYIMDI